MSGYNAILSLELPRVIRARDKALAYANTDEDVLVEAGVYSAKHWALKALAAVTTPSPISGVNGFGNTAGLTLDTDAKTANDSVSLDFKMHNSSDVNKVYGQLITLITDPTASSEDADLYLKALQAGVSTTVLRSNGMQLLAPGTMKVASDLTLATGSIKSDSGQVSFDNENIITTGKVTAGNGTGSEQVVVTGAGSVNGAVLKVIDAGAVSVGIYAPSPTILWLETDTVNQNYMARLDSGVLKFGTQNDAISSFTSKLEINQSGQMTLFGRHIVANGYNLLVGGTVAGNGTNAVHLFNGTPPSAGVADALQLFSKDRSAGNTILGIRSEGSGILQVGTAPAASGTMAIEINGSIKYVHYSNTAAS